MHYFRCLSVVGLSLVFFACGKAKSDAEAPNEARKSVIKERKVRFAGNYARDFNDLQELQIEAAINNGVDPLETRDDTLKLAKKLVRLPNELELYKMYELKHSIPFLVPSAAQLLMDISKNFRDSLYSKDLPLYRIFVTSVTRTNEDMKRLRRGNLNASDNSTHCYATTFDISWKQFDQIDRDSLRRLSPDRLKLVLGQVLFDLRQQQRCYVKHERKQACFHITVR
ncbi:MAG: DUF5715 family protein [Dysgonamonadaceae bacterium]|jgi:hypothetical protein|nr:DUF5715 family protein [Dysgonamonadaceae bacterium]